MTQPDTPTTPDLPGVAKPVRGRPAKHGVAMTAAERQREYRRRQAQKARSTMSSELGEQSTATLIEALRISLSVIDDENQAQHHPSRRGMAASAVHELIRRYELPMYDSRGNPFAL